MRKERFGLFVCGFGSISAGLNLPQARGEGKEKADGEKSRENSLVTCLFAMTSNFLSCGFIYFVCSKKYLF
jgi:hypothetical protein